MRKSCGCGPGGCSGPTRRQVLRAAALLPGLPFMAGPFRQSDFEKLVPADKKLNPEWVKSLYARGTRTIYGGAGRMAELEKIGMPVGGVCAGQLYLGGDGKLWGWDIFNHHERTTERAYIRPHQPSSPLDQGFAIRVKTAGKSVVKVLDHTGFNNINFCGEYPIGTVEYRDETLPVAVSLEAFSPFIPLNADDSSLPATVLRFTLKNTGAEPVEGDLAGWLENAVCLHSRPSCTLTNKINRIPGALCLECHAETPVVSPNHPDIVFEDFEKGNYDGWAVTGTGFGKTPVSTKDPSPYVRGAGAQGAFFALSAREGPHDKAVGTMTSREFKVERDYIIFMISGGNHKERTCINLLVDGKVVDSTTGPNTPDMVVRKFDVRALLGKTARLQIVDAAESGWKWRNGYVGIDQIVFTNTPLGSLGPFSEEFDFGTMTLALLDSVENGYGSAGLPDGRLPDVLFDEEGLASGPESSRQMGRKLCGAVGRGFALKPGEQDTAAFVVAWNFPNLVLDNGGPGHGRIQLDDSGRYYANRFRDTTATVAYLAEKIKELTDQTRLWHDTWYDSSLPYWFLDRTFANASTMATSTCHRFKSGRFWGWEGVECCPGTCTHVWHYAHAVARLFPELERIVRERVDFGIALDEKTGQIMYRGEKEREKGLFGLSGNGSAVDGQAGTILRVYREHQMSPDNAFLKRIWPKVKLGLEWLIGLDGDGDGLIEGAQHNTLDCDFYGPSAWLSGMYVAALYAGEAMALDMGDEAYAKKVHAIAETGSRKIVEVLYEGEYFIHKPDPKHAGATNTTTGCDIDQVLGQCWMHQVNLGRMLPEDKTVSALKSLWKYNFTMDVGPYRRKHGGGRVFAEPGEAGLIMCTWPKGEGEIKHVNRSPLDLFSECMHGFEYQAAGHMIFEGLLEEGLAVTRSIHDRYHALRRNPWNEVECGEHYARSMASYGVFIAVCGFECHGPRGHIGFAPHMTPENFKAAFTAAEGWGAFEQKLEGGRLIAKVVLKYGKLRLKTISLGLPKGMRPRLAKVTVRGKPVGSTLDLGGRKAVIALEADAMVKAGDSLVAVLE